MNNKKLLGIVSVSTPDVNDLIRRITVELQKSVDRVRYIKKRLRFISDIALVVFAVVQWILTTL